MSCYVSIPSQDVFHGTSTFSPVLLLPSISLAPTKHEIIKQKSSRQRPRDISRPLKVRCVSKGKNFPPIYVLCTYIGRLISLVYETKSSQTEVPDILEGSYSNEVYILTRSLLFLTRYNEIGLSSRALQLSVQAIIISFQTIHIIACPHFLTDEILE